MSSQSDTKALIERVVVRFLDEVPALKPLNVVVGLDLRARGDTQMYRLEMPSMEITKDIAADAKIRVEVPRAFFNEMAKDATVADWHEAFRYGQAKATGVTQYLKLIAQVVERQEERNRTRRAKHHD